MGGFRGCPNFEKSIRRERMGRAADIGGALWLGGTVSLLVLETCGGLFMGQSCSLGGVL